MDWAMEHLASKYYRGSKYIDTIYGREEISVRNDVFLAFRCIFLVIHCAALVVKTYVLNGHRMNLLLKKLGFLYIELFTSSFNSGMLGAQIANENTFIHGMFKFWIQSLWLVPISILFLICMIKGNPHFLVIIIFALPIIYGILGPFFIWIGSMIVFFENFKNRAQEVIV